ncbi:MAG: NAD(P)/FAD-dependent oxidoreductase [Cryobacterium sp.]|nr:NAD(P)/FAD-dependent oxidoreductase [Cryobacterium sp.]
MTGIRPPGLTDREWVTRAVADAEIPALMVALADALGDDSMVPDDLRPPNRKVALPEAQGGLSQQQQTIARGRAVDGVLRLLAGDDRVAPKSKGDKGFRRRLMDYLIGDVDGSLLKLLDRELGYESAEAEPAAVGALAEDFTVAIIGGGMSGIAMAYRLKRAGIPFVILEKNHDMGGTWLENVYPGVRLDTNNFAYGFSFAQTKDWTHQFSEGSTILEYFRSLCDSENLWPHFRFSTRVDAATFDATTGSWTLEVTSDGVADTVTARALVSAVGQLNLPKLPDIVGVGEFSGLEMHSARWDPNVDLVGQRVAVIGTGASAYQVVPAIAADVEQLHVFQRTAPWIMPTRGYYEPLKPGFAWLLQVVPNYERWFRFWQFWTATEGRLPYVGVDPEWKEPGSVSAANRELREVLESRIREQFTDREDLMAQVIPDYPPGAKRMLRDGGAWSTTLKRDNVGLHTEGIRSIEPTGISTVDGSLIEVDVIIYCTGFQAANSLDPIRITGLEGLSLKEHWSGDPRAYLGITIPHFPNLYCLYGPNTNLVVNGSATFMTEAAVDYILASITTMIREGYRYLDCTPEALERFIADVDSANAERAWGVESVTSWYKSSSGRVSQVWPYDLTTYWNLTRDVDLDDYTVVVENGT